MIHVGTRSGRSPRAACRKISFLVEDEFDTGIRLMDYALSYQKQPLGRMVSPPRLAH